MFLQVSSRIMLFSDTYTISVARWVTISTISSQHYPCSSKLVRLLLMLRLYKFHIDYRRFSGRSFRTKSRCIQPVEPINCSDILLCCHSFDGADLFRPEWESVRRYVNILRMSTKYIPHLTHVDAVNMFWFSSLVFSIAAAVNGFLGLTWKQTM